MDVFLLSRRPQNQTAGEWFIIFILFDNFSSINTLYDIINRNTALCQTTTGVFRNSDLFRLVHASQPVEIDHNASPSFDCIVPQK